MTLPRTLEQIVEDQARHWKERRVTRPGAHRPVVAISRLPGARGGEIAQRLASDLDYRLWGRELIHQIAVDTRLSESLVSALDETNRSFLDDWLGSMLNDRHLSRNEYVFHLTRVIGALGREGGVVLIGRGAHLVLRAGEALRVLVTAPLHARIAHVAARHGVSEPEARRRLEAEETARRAFLQQSFRSDLTDLHAFDLIVNSQTLGIAGAVGAIKSSLAALRPVPHPEHATL